MRVRRINSSNDWTFGRGRADYVLNSAAIRQNVFTRLRSFTDDWFLDIEAGVDWLNLLGSRGNERRILRAVESTVLQTEGVVSITRLRLIGVDTDRGATIDLTYTDVFDEVVADRVQVTV